MTSNLTIKGLMREIKYVEENIEIKKKIGKDYSFEEDLLKAWRQYLPGGKLNHRLAQVATR